MRKRLHSRSAIPRQWIGSKNVVFITDCQVRVHSLHQEKTDFVTTLAVESESFVGCCRIYGALLRRKNRPAFVRPRVIGQFSNTSGNSLAETASSTVPCERCLQFEVGGGSGPVNQGREVRANDGSLAATALRKHPGGRPGRDRCEADRAVNSTCC